jgi:hypothetical protein
MREENEFPALVVELIPSACIRQTPLTVSWVLLQELFNDN